MSSFMDRLMGRKPSPAQSAKERLKLVLVTDRTTISPEDLNNMQREILEIIRKYCRVNEDAVELKFEQRERENYLVADIPLAGNRFGEEAGAVHFETTITVADRVEEVPQFIEEAPVEAPIDTAAAEAPVETPAEPIANNDDETQQGA